MTIRRADEEKEDDYTVATCLEHAGDILTMFTQHAVAGRLALVQAAWLNSTVSDTTCKCGRRAAFVLVHVYDDPPRVPPTVPVGLVAPDRPAHCVGTHDKRHRDLCVACGLTPGGRHGL